MSPLSDPSNELSAIIHLLRSATGRYLALLRSSAGSADQQEQLDLDGAGLSALGFSYAALGRLANVYMEIHSPLSTIEAEHEEGRSLARSGYKPILPPGAASSKGGKSNDIP